MIRELCVVQRNVKQKRRRIKMKHNSAVGKRVREGGRQRVGVWHFENVTIGLKATPAKAAVRVIYRNCGVCEFVSLKNRYYTITRLF